GKNIYVQEVLRKNSTKPQWYITESDEILPTKFNELTKEKKDKIIAELLILYPHDLIQTSGYQENIKSNYDRISQSLVSKYFYYSPSVRDLFSAGGKIKINNVFFPRLLEKYNLDRKSTRLNSSHVSISYAVFCLKKKKKKR